MPAIPDRWLSLDGGTMATGAVLWEGDRPVAHWLVLNDHKAPADVRISRTAEAVDQLVQDYAPKLVVIEDWGGARNPYLRTLITSLGQRVRARKVKWATIHNSTVVSAVAPRGFPMRQREDRKRAVRAGVEAMYPRFIGVEEDVIDAAAVGHAWLARAAAEKLSRV